VQFSGRGFLFLKQKIKIMEKLNVEEIVVDGKTYIPKINMPQKVCGMEAVLIRSYGAGVHFGYLQSKEYKPDGTVVVLIDTRRVYYWDGAASLSQMAVDGVTKPENCKFSMQVDKNEIANVIEILSLSERAFKNLNSVPIWKKIDGDGDGSGSGSGSGYGDGSGDGSGYGLM
jgi:hypothetical protein